MLTNIDLLFTVARPKTFGGRHVHKRRPNWSGIMRLENSVDATEAVNGYSGISGQFDLTHLGSTRMRMKTDCVAHSV